LSSQDQYGFERAALIKERCWPKKSFCWYFSRWRELPRTRESVFL